ncbi:MAG: hypothetical protein NT164_02615 [Verrucomicrobiae bacterium]|nr:hypothetical protein [Verrucomicrobiae bacterium]
MTDKTLASKIDLLLRSALQAQPKMTHNEAWEFAVKSWGDLGADFNSAQTKAWNSVIQLLHRLFYSEKKENLTPPSYVASRNKDAPERLANIKETALSDYQKARAHDIPDREAKDLAAKNAAKKASYFDPEATPLQARELPRQAALQSLTVLGESRNAAKEKVQLIAAAILNEPIFIA